MAIPRIFVSSTCYDLKYIRENLKYFITSMGYESILSEEGDVYYNPDEHTHDACLGEVETCQIFVLIIGGRYGGKYLGTEQSITNKEYEEARKLNIPIFTLVEKNVLSEHFVYQKNKGSANAGKIIFPSVDNLKIFGFIDQVRKSSINNAIFPFSDFKDIEIYLKKQWAGMMYNFLTNSIETKKVSELFEKIHRATDKIEYYTKQVALNVGDERTSILIKCYEILLGSSDIQSLQTHWGIKVTPYMVVKHATLDDICNHQIEIEETAGLNKYRNSITTGGPPYRCTQTRYGFMESGYRITRACILKAIKSSGYDEDDFLKLENQEDRVLQ